MRTREGSNLNDNLPGLSFYPNRKNGTISVAAGTTISGSVAPLGSSIFLPFQIVQNKFSGADARECRRWDDYQLAFSEMLAATSTTKAPWYVIPADRKWFARLGAAAVLTHTLMEMDPRFPAEPTSLCRRTREPRHPPRRS